jgi:hypothetical protein
MKTYSPSHSHCVPAGKLLPGSKRGGYKISLPALIIKQKWLNLPMTCTESRHSTLRKEATIIVFCLVQTSNALPARKQNVSLFITNILLSILAGYYSSSTKVFSLIFTYSLYSLGDSGVPWGSIETTDGLVLQDQCSVQRQGWDSKNILCMQLYWDSSVHVLRTKGRRWKEKLSPQSIRDILDEWLLAGHQTQLVASTCFDFRFEKGI